MRNKIIWFCSTVLMTLAACFLLRMGETHLEGLRGEPSPKVVARSSEIQKLAIAIKHVAHEPIALPKDELGQLGEKTLSALPTLADFKNLSVEQMHTTPEILFEAGMKLKAFQDELDEKLKAANGNPQELQAIASEGADFYQNCANLEQSPSSLRAVCYIHFIEFSVKSGHPENVPKNRMPLDVLTIAKSIIPKKA